MLNSGARPDLERRKRLSVALLSDTHGQLDPRIGKTVLDCDIAVHAGDVGAADVIAALRPRLGIVIAVRGNNDIPDKWCESDQDLLAQLKEVATLEIPGGRLVVVHGDRHNPARHRHRLLRADFPDARAILYGHSHRLVIEDEQHPWVLNPGAAGRARTFGGPSCLILNVSAREWQVNACRFQSLRKAREHRVLT